MQNKASNTFRSSILATMKKLKMSKGDLAKKLRVNPSYVTKLFKENNNYTFETAEKLAKAVGKKLNVEIVEENV